MKQAYIKQRFNRSSKYIISKAIEIIEKEIADGYTLTLRQLYYKFIGYDYFPEDRRYLWTGSKWIRSGKGTKNAQPNYKWLGEVINNARMAGLIDWLYIEDRTRNLKRVSTWDNPASIIDSAYYSYNLDKWKDSPVYIEVWVEKDALIGVVQKAVNYWQVPFFACRGYVSQSAMHNGAARRFINRSEKKCILLYLGDHDPSGIDMSRDIKERLKLFGAKVTIKRIALNINQVKKYNLPPSPAKITDSRCNAYIKEFGQDSWELDALENKVIDDLIQSHIKKYMDFDSWKIAVEQENRDKEILKRIVDDLENGKYDEDYEDD